MTILLAQLINSLVQGSIYVLIASGVTLIYGLTNNVMFAQGALLMLGGYFTYGYIQAGIPIVLAIVLSIVTLGVIGVILERGLFSRVGGRAVNGFIISLGLIIVLENSVSKATGGRTNVNITMPVSGTWTWWGVVVPIQRVIVFGVAMATMAGLILVLRKTRLGWALRATAENRVAAEFMGIPARRLMIGTFVVGCGLAALGGSLLLTLVPLTPYVGDSVIVNAFAIAIIGGLGSVEGAVVAAMVIAFVEGLGGSYLEPALTSVYGFAIMIIMLLVRPQGFVRGVKGAELH